jgi:hypothetical protein
MRLTDQIIATAGDPGNTADEHPHERMARRINECAGGSATVMRGLVEEFSEAWVADWGCAFGMTPSPEYDGDGLLIHQLVDLLHSFPDLSLAEFAQAWVVARQRGRL